MCTGSAVPIHIDGDNMMDLVVTGAYYRGDTIIAGRLSVYRRLPAQPNRPYLFEEVQRLILPNILLGSA